MPAASQSPEHFNLLHFMVQDLYCCLHVQYVEQVIPLLEVKSVPGGLDYMIGLMNLHGSSVPLIDLGQCMGYPQTETYTLETPIILIHHDNRRTGLVVSEILEVRQCSQHDLQMSPEFTRGDLPYKGVVNFGSNLSLLLDIDRITNIQLGDTDIMPSLSKVKDNPQPNQRT